MGSSVLRSKGPSFSFRPFNLRAVGARFISFCQDHAILFQAGNRSNVNEAQNYLCGLTMKAQRKNIERMEEYVKDSDYESMQHFIFESSWNNRNLIAKISADTNDLIGSEEAVLAIDESAFTKKGDKSVGVSRQYNGRLGKIDNCQVGVFGALTDGKHFGLIDSKIYLPEEWIASPDRCHQAGIPKMKIVFKTKPQLGLEIIDTAISNGVEFGWVSFDGFYGNVPDFINGLYQRELTFIGAVHKDQIIYGKHPQPYLPRRTKKIGRKHSIYKTKEIGIRVDELIKKQPRSWKLITIREGTKGYVGVFAQRHRVWLWDVGTENVKEIWFVILKDPFTNEIKYFISNAKHDSTLTALTQKAAYRFFIERAFQDAKTSVGMADYQVRVWNGWHHHIAMVMLAMQFLLKERIINEQDVTLLSCQDLVELLNFYLPRGDLDEEAIIKQLEKRHEKRNNAIINSYKRQKEKYPNLKFNLTK